ncbi:MAG: flagellar biosynthesis protein FlhA [Opitutales bacterium]|tara:strand:- start:3639 stop:5828 length:2190 start_codon:yes stop_codon:yes gene_type:complete
MNALNSKTSGLLAGLSKHKDLAFTFALFGTVILLILPISPRFMDLFLAASIGISLLILLVVIYVKDPPEFSVFPTILLAVTLYRLGLNVASTRLILLDGYAGEVIQSFGNFVVRGNYVVGAVVFLILVIINFIVITKGAGRIAEVAARFTLDAMPGKQMAIDAELNAGIIDEETATRRRTKIQKEADFYGAMDGASKFVRGDAIAGILITIINVVGGITIGMFQRGLSLTDAMEKYTLLSIGDGLVSQVPALIVSVAAGILVTRTGEKSNLGSFVSKQLTLYPRAIGIAAAMLILFSVMPGMPSFPFLMLGACCGFFAYFMKKQGLGQDALSEEDDSSDTQIKKEENMGEESSSDGKSSGRDQDFYKAIEVDTFAVELGYGLLSFADNKQDGDLLDRITGARKAFAREMGMIMPPIALRDNPELESNQYRFLLRGKEIARGMAMSGRWLAMNVSGSSVALEGVSTVEPVFKLEAVWVDEEEKKNAELNGYTVVDAISVLITHLSESLKYSAYLVLEREDTQRLLDKVKDKNPTLVNELLPDLVSVGLIQRVLRNLLKEKIPIKNLTIILETIADYASVTKSPDDLSEQARKRLGVYFVEEFESKPGVVHALTLDPKLEQLMVSAIKRTQFDLSLMMDPSLAQHLLTCIAPKIDEMAERGIPPILVVTSELRLAFKRFFEPSFPTLTVLSYQELPDTIHIENVGIVTGPATEFSQMASASAASNKPDLVE